MFGKAIYSRGGSKVLEIAWLTKWKGEEANHFTGNVFHNGKKLAFLVDGKEELGATNRPLPEGYVMSFAQKKDGSLWVTVYHQESKRDKKGKKVNEMARSL